MNNTNNNTPFIRVIQLPDCAFNLDLLVCVEDYPHAGLDFKSKITLMGTEDGRITLLTRMSVAGICTTIQNSFGR